MVRRPITIRVEDSQRAALEAYAEAHDQSASDVIRDLIAELVGPPGGAEPGTDRRRLDDLTPATIAPSERYLMALMHDVLDLLNDPTHPDRHHRKAAEILRDGFAGEYGNLVGALRAELSRAEASLLWDILDMFRVLKGSMSRLEAPIDPASIEDLTFHGFDGNDTREVSLLTYLRYLIKTDRRWTDLEDDFDAADGGNSHVPMLPTYERMLEVFRPIWREVVHGRGQRRARLDLNADELRKVAAAA
ncbi:YfbU family protein [Isoptericola croceus]|uniref:YfbU family protein n=1 Tax=Isoptericola croceus TaxID=3031406 RepID=UPI0023FA3894|nr:YfbU family protein [Isoptericola croceus]